MEDTGPGGHGPGPVNEPAEVELLFWESVKDSLNPEELQAYLDRYPAGIFAALARSRLRRLTGPEVTPDEAVLEVTPELPAPTPESIEMALSLDREERRRIQRGLALLGFDPGSADGLFGQRTRKALETWQLSQKMAATGYLDAQVSRVLMAAVKSETSIIVQLCRQTPGFGS